MNGLCLPQLAQPLKLWEKIELVIGEDATAGHYLSRIEDFVDDGILIDKPEMVSGSTLLRDNADIAVVVTKDDAVYQFFCQVRKHDNQHFFLTLPENVKRVQRRRFVRIDISEDILYAPTPPATVRSQVGDFLKWHTGRGLNLSGGGILLRTSEEVAENDIVLMKIPVFCELRLPEIVATVCRRVTADDDQFRCGMEFAEVNSMKRHFPPKYLKRLPRSVRDFNHHIQAILVDHVFKHQISLRQKGLL